VFIVIISCRINIYPYVEKAKDKIHNCKEQKYNEQQHKGFD
jgi:hypothetical protein